ncbi:MAG: amidohydrolase family protein [Lentisphaerae bacterium]|nr:amidohydrolase family protein [Lentisphaerota bacterium]
MHPWPAAGQALWQFCPPKEDPPLEENSYASSCGKLWIRGIWLMKWMACDPLIGRPRVPAGNLASTRDDLLAEMRRLGIQQAVVRHGAALECGPMAGNRQLMKETRRQPRLMPAWFLTPDGQEPDFRPETAVAAMLKAGARVAWMDPEAEDFSLLPWCSGALYEILQARRVPLLLDYLKIKADDLDRVLTDFPELRLILLNVPRLGRNRRLYPLLRRHPHLYVCLSHTYSVFRGIEDLCEQFGPLRWVFGMGYPAAEGGAAIAGVLYADISRETRAAIAHGNLERLLKEVQR